MDTEGSSYFFVDGFFREHCDEHPPQPHEQPEDFFLRIFNTAIITRIITSIIIRISHMFINHTHPASIPISLTITAASQPMAHCHKITPRAHFRPSSRRIEAMAATHGV